MSIDSMSPLANKSPRPRAVVMADVARLAGVSHQTVSRVLNDNPNVRPATRERVLAAIRELDYRPNPAARTLVTRRSHTLGVVSFDTTLYGPASMLYGIERAAHDAGYFVSIASLRLARPRVGARARWSGCASQARRGHHRDRAAGVGRAGAARTCPTGRAGRGGRGGPDAPCPRRGRPHRRARAPPRATCSTSATAPSGTSPARRTGWRPRSASTAGARRSTHAGAAAARACWPATGARGRATSSASSWPPSPR